MLELRHHDGANQLGDLAQGAYSDWTHYAPVNKPAYAGGHPVSVANADRWQPLVYVDDKGDMMTQRFAGAQWCNVLPFAMRKGDQFRSLMQRFGPATCDTARFRAQAQKLVDLSAQLTDTQKMISEYWSDGPTTVQPPGHWFLFAQYVSLRDGHSLDQDVKMFFVLANAMFDSGVAARGTKRTFDSVRPISALPALFIDEPVHAWGGPGKGTVEMDGAQWRPCQLATFPTPPFPDYVSGHSTFSAAAAEILLLWTGSDRFGDSVTLAPGSSKIEPGITPARPITLHWKTFTDAAVAGFVAVSNVSSHSLSIDLGVSDRASDPIAHHELPVPSHATEFVQLPELTAATTSDGGIRAFDFRSEHGFFEPIRHAGIDGRSCRSDVEISGRHHLRSLRKRA